MHMLTELGRIECACKVLLVISYTVVIGGFVVAFLRDRRPA